MLRRPPNERPRCCSPGVFVAVGSSRSRMGGDQVSVHVEWMTEALCRGMDPELVFPSLPGVPGKRQVEAAVRICADCPVIVECRQYAKTASRGHGVWGGLPRRHVTSERQQPPIAHGTAGGYRAHQRRGVTPCEPCRRANTLYYRTRGEK